MSELKPCPFCGQKVDYHFDLELAPIGIRCNHCRMIVRYLGVPKVKKNMMYGEMMEQIAKKWNKRGVIWE